MRLYLDDDMAAPLLARLLRKAGHDAERPADVGMIGKDDPVHLTHAIEVERVLLTGNCRDFANLHNLVLKAKGHHPGIWVVRRDNDQKRDLSPSGIVMAVQNLCRSGIDIPDNFLVLNHWR